MSRGFLVENGGVQSSIQDAGRRGFSDIGLTQSGAMDEFDCRREFAGAVAAAAEEARRSQGDERTDTFAAGIDQMRGQVRDDADGARQIGMDNVVDCSEVFAQ